MPWRPHEENAFRNSTAQLLELLRLACRNSMISCSSSLASSTPATSLKVTFFCELDDSLALLLPNESALLPPALHLPHEEDPEADHQQNGRPRVEQRGPRTGGRLARGDDDSALEQSVRQPFKLRGGVGAETLVALAGARNLVAGDRHPRNLTRVDRGHELAEGQRIGARLEPRGEVPHEDADHHQGHPEDQALHCRVHNRPPRRTSVKIIT